MAEISKNLIAVGVKPVNIVIHERGGGQILLPKYDQFVPTGIRVESANTWLGLDPDVFVEVDFFGEDDTRSYLIRMVSEPFTKIINVPNMNRSIREPGHIEYASTLGLGVYDLSKIHHTELTV